MEAGIW